MKCICLMTLSFFLLSGLIVLPLAHTLCFDIGMVVLFLSGSSSVSCPSPLSLLPRLGHDQRLRAAHFGLSSWHHGPRPRAKPWPRLKLRLRWLNGGSRGPAAAYTRYRGVREVWTVHRVVTNLPMANPSTLRHARFVSALSLPYFKVLCTTEPWKSLWGRWTRTCQDFRWESTGTLGLHHRPLPRVVYYMIPMRDRGSRRT